MRQSGQSVEKVFFYKTQQILYPYPQTPFPGKGAILLGLPPLVPVGGFAPCDPILICIRGFSKIRRLCYAAEPS